MYYIVESPKVLNFPITDVSHIKQLKANRDSMFICAITGNDIMIWLTTTSNLIAFYQRADNSVQIHGENHTIEWKSDSSKIVVMTTKGYLIYYKITFENEFVLTDLSFSQTAWNDFSFNNSQYQNPLLTSKITHEFSIHIQNCQKAICCFGDEIYVPLYNGKVIKVPWTDRTRVDHFFFQLQSIYFQHEAEGEQFKIKDNIYIVEFEIINSDDGCISIAGTLSDGNAIYISTDQSNVFRGLITKNNQEKNLIHKGLIINPLYKLLVFSCKNNTAIAYKQPYYSNFVVSNKYESANQKNQENNNISMMKWSPDYRVLCILYDNGNFCLFSVFGHLLYDSKDLLSFQLADKIYSISKALEFGVEGYSLWTYLQTTDSSLQGNLVKLKTLKSSMINNCSMSNIEHISLNGEREVYACLNLIKSDLYSANKLNVNNKIPVKYQYPSHKLGGNSIWQILNTPLTYVSTNFPIRMTAIDPEGKYLAVAGTNGFTHYSFLTRKWKIFGNADQEKEFQATGGLLWWKDFICMTCHNSNENKDELRFYSRNTNLDNTYSKISRTTCSILQMNIFKNMLILFGTDCVVQVIGLEGGKDSVASKIILNRLIELQITNYIHGNPYLVVSVALCPLTCGINQNDLIRSNIESSSSTLKSILINVSGKLLMFQPEAKSVLSIPKDLKKSKSYTSLPPVLTSDCVENYWIIPNNQSIKLQNHLMNLTLWLNCGAKGVKLWLPLSGEENELQQSNRVFLKLAINFYPLSLLINEALFIGVTSELTLINQDLAYSQLQKATQLFIPHMIEGLIRKKLFLDAKKISICYRYLPYFLHSLELVIHKVLEDEANSSMDVSEQILKDVVQFVETFPEYLKIILHCTRKSEVAVWPHLFSIVGDSCKLFEKCLSLNDLETAASYLVVLQNTEKLKLCQKYANMLLKASLKSCEWDLVKEIIRFLSAIDPNDLEAELFDQSTDSKYHESPDKMPKSSKSPLSPQTSTSTVDENAQQQKTPKQNRTPKSRCYSSVDYQINIQTISNTVYEHAYFLLSNYRMKQLFGMFANLNGFSIKRWLQQYQGKRVVANYVMALSGLHFDFNWPYPILINQFKKTNSFVSPDMEIIDLTNEDEKVDEKKDENNLHPTDPVGPSIDILDMNLIAQELANTGSSQSEKHLSFLIDTFISANCYEWVFLLALVLKRMAIVNEIMRQLLAEELPEETASSLKQGLKELNNWSKNECCGYRSLIKKISEYC